MKKIVPKLLLLAFATVALSQVASSQIISPADRKKLRSKEDSLKVYARFMVTDSFAHSRLIADSFFTRILVRALQIRNSFYYPFSSVAGISALYAPDSSFRIFTWNVQHESERLHSFQKGAIQMPVKDGSLKLYRLLDVSDFIDRVEDSIRYTSNWIGAVYYNIVKTEFNGKKYYTLFGLDNNSFMSTKKWVEVLTFNTKNEPVFGGPYFTYQNDSLRQKPKYRLSLEYKKNARVLMNYIPDLDVILMDHLISETEEPDNKWSFVPDGDNEAFKWENGRWVHIDKAFDFKLDMTGADAYMGKPPLGDPLLDQKGNKNEKKLDDKSNKNKTKEKPINDDN